MAVSSMKKLSLFALKDDADLLINQLMWLSCVELHKADADEGYAPCDCEKEYALTSQRYERIQEAITVLKPYEEDKKGLFAWRRAVKRDDFENGKELYFAAVQSAEAVLDAKSELLSVRSEQNKIRARISALNPWADYDLPLGYTGTENTRVILGSFPVTADTDGAFGALYAESDRVIAEKVSEDDAAVYYSVIVYGSDADTAIKTLGSYGFTRSDFPTGSGSAYEQINSAREELLTLENSEKQIIERLMAFAADIPDLEFACDIASTEVVKMKAHSLVSTSASTVYITGWVPEKAVPRVTKVLGKSPCAYEFSEPGEDDEVPVLLNNNKWAKPFEYVVKMYSLPRYGTFDPTFIMSIFYFIIFGMMLGDVIYGLFLIFGGFVVWRKLDVSRGVKDLAQMFCFCGISCVVFGVIFGGYFGDLPIKIMQNMFGDFSVTNVALCFDPTTGTGPIYFLVMSFVAGAVHLLFGMGIQAGILIKNGHPFAALFDIGSWYVLFAGIGLFFVNSTVGAVVALTGVLMLVFSQGRDAKNPIMKIFGGVKSLYNIVNYISDLLSYSRIMALGLASAIIASVVNILATMPAGGLMGSIGGKIAAWIIMTAILIFGHTLNLVINLLGTFVHTSRLQYIEFFGKFFEDGGREFEPIMPDATYTRIEDETLISEEK